MCGAFSSPRTAKGGAFTSRITRAIRTYTHARVRPSYDEVYAARTRYILTLILSKGTANVSRQNRNVQSRTFRVASA